MCRISGIISKNVNEQIVVDMRDSLHSGGPDDSGYFIDKESHIGLGHRRLSILDTSSAGHQPMSWGKFVIVYNGEVYNFKEIAAELEKLGYHISSGSDTEVILKSFECWGYSCVNKFRGMFAFAIWDKSDEKLILCRDRIGTKPLYYYLKDDLFMFASELKSFHVHEDFDKSIDFKAVSLFLQTGYIKSPYSIFQFAHKLEPGGFLEIDKNLKIRKWKYWSAREIYKNTEINS
jgi:asparagine synthase (glutamine-hydrolysing)